MDKQALVRNLKIRANVQASREGKPLPWPDEPASGVDWSVIPPDGELAPRETINSNRKKAGLPPISRAAYETSKAERLEASRLWASISAGNLDEA